MAKRDEFIAAVKSQNIAEVLRLLELGVSPNLIVDVPRRLRAIDYAKHIRNDELLSALVAYGARNDEKRIAISSSSSSSSMEVCQSNIRAQFVSAVQAKNHSELTRLLKSYPFINPNTMMDADKNTALHYACLQGDTITVGLLMQHSKTLIKIKNKQGLTPVDIAVKYRNVTILVHLSAHADFKGLINSLFNQAWEKDDKPAVFFLSRHLDCIEFSKISIAIKHRDFETFQRVLSEGHSLSSAEVFQVVESNDERFINLAMSNSIDFEVRAPGASENILVLLAKKDKWSAVLTFVNNHPLAGLDLYGYTELLLLALESENEAVIEALLAAKTPLNCLYGQQGQTLLNALRDNGLQKIISLLLNAAAHDENMVKYLKFNTSSIPPHLQSYFTDAVMLPFTKPVITVHGFTYESEGILNWLATNPNDPVTREPVLAHDLLPNTDVILLMEYYLLNGDNITEGFPLINRGTNFFYIDPVVAEDGRTYEREELRKYLSVHDNFLPLHSPGDEAKKQNPLLLRSNRLFKAIIEEQYLKKEFLHYLETRQYNRLREMLVKGFAINTTLDDVNNQLSHFAILDDDLTLLNLCFEFGADFQRKNGKEQTAIQLASQSNDLSFYTRILENLSIHKPADFTFFFKEQLQSNNLPVVTYLLQNYRACCRPVIMEALRENNVTAEALELILTNEEDPTILDEIDAMLPNTIESENINLLQVLLKKAPMRSLLTIKGTKILQNMVKNRDANAQLITIIYDAASDRHLSVAFHIHQILEPEVLQEEKEEEDELMLPVELDDLVTDPIDTYPFENPLITPTGQSFSAHSIENLAENPLSRAPLTNEQLRPNILLGDLVKFLQCASTDVDSVPPMLFSLFTLTLMTKPMVAENGLTYDEAELPQAMRESCYPDVSMQALCSYYRAKQEKSGQVVFFGGSYKLDNPIQQINSIEPTL